MRFRAARLLLLVPLIAGCFVLPAPAGASRPRALAGANPYFPLQSGNRWLYQLPGPAGSAVVRSVQVTEQVAGPDGRSYFALEGYFGPRHLVRSEVDGSVYELQGNPFVLWYLLRAPVGATWILNAGVPAEACISGSQVTVASRSDTVRVPAGEFRNVVRLEYSGPCADAGLLAEWFAPGIGLVKRDENSVAGPRSMELISASVRGQVLPRRATATSLILDRPVYVHEFLPGPWVGPADRKVAVVSALLVLGARGDLPAEFVFDGCKSATFRILDALGNEVLKVRGDDGGCCGCGEEQSLTSLGRDLVLGARIPLAREDGTPLPEGLYAVEATLDVANLGPPLRPSARAPFRLVNGP